MRNIAIIILVVFSFQLNAQKQENILYYTLKGFTGKQVVLFGTKGKDYFPVDTAKVQSTGAFVFNNIGKHPSGIYRLYFNDSIYNELILNNENIIIESDVKHIIKYMNVKQSIENKIFFDYWKFAMEIKDSIAMWNIQKSNLLKLGHSNNSSKIKKLNTNIMYYNKSLDSYIDNQLKEHPYQFAPKLIKAYTLPKMEDFNKQNPNNQYTSEKDFYFNHFFDNIDFSDERFVRTKVLHVSISDFIKNFGEPASTENYIKIIDKVMSLASSNIEVKKYCINLFMKSFENTIWEDVYVYIIDNYYLTTFKSRFIQMHYSHISKSIKALKIGNKAPNLILKDTSGNIHNLHQSTGKAKIIVFYSTDCPHCAKALPGLVELYNMYSEYGVIAWGINIDNNINTWKKEINEFKLNWTNVSDMKGLSSQIIKDYNINNTPYIYILDENNAIVAKPKSVAEIHAILVQLINF